MVIACFFFLQLPRAISDRLVRDERGRDQEFLAGQGGAPYRFTHSSALPPGDHSVPTTQIICLQATGHVQKQQRGEG